MKTSPKFLTACSSILLGAILFGSVFGANAAISAQHDQKFEIELFKKVSAQKAKENVLVSPLSASLALGMVLNGASGPNKQEMCRVMGTSADKLDQFNSRNKSVIASLNASKDVTLEVANAVYSDKKTPFQKSFVDLCKSVYSAAAENLDFEQKFETLAAINSWCSEKTHGKISKILTDLKETDKMVLLNAIYFKGKWSEQFQKAATRDQNFAVEKGKNIKVKMMHRTGELRYYQGDNFAAISLPYRGGKQSMYVFLPDEGVSVNAFQAKLTGENWKKWMSSFTQERVAVSLPKLKIEFEDELNKALKTMGMNLAFMEDTPGLFSGLVTSPAKAGLNIPGANPNVDFIAWISKVVQKTFMEVSEEGTEAAAVTAVVMGCSAPCVTPQPKIIDFTVDHPYVLALVDEQSGEILFMGKILKPQS